MMIHSLLMLYIFLFHKIMAEDALNVTIVVEGTLPIAETDENFVCATLDWWPREKCNYQQCPWGQASILNLDLQNPILAEAIKEFDRLRVRLGGSLQDQVLYDIGKLGSPCLPFTKKADGLFGFSNGCLSMERWDELNLLFKKTRAIVTFGLNALYGRHKAKDNLWIGPWNASNARDFIEYTISKGNVIDSWEFGNELSGSGVGARVSVLQYGKDLIYLKSILGELYENSTFPPKLLAPGGFFDQEWFAKLLQVSGTNVINALTHHIYNLGSGGDPYLISKILDPHYLDQIATTFSNLKLTIEKQGPWATAWVGESGGAYNSGARSVSDTFVNSFWYLDQLGMSAKYGTKVYCRQSLIGGNYGLLNLTSFKPNPDYYGALLWHRLMGKTVLAANFTGSHFLRAYAHCTKGKAGVTLLLINLSNTTEFNILVQNNITTGLPTNTTGGRHGSFVHSLKKSVAWVGQKARAEVQREEHHLTAKDGYLQSQTVVHNGIPVEMSADGRIPRLDPILVDMQSPIFVSPLSIAFVSFPNFDASACG